MDPANRKLTKGFVFIVAAVAALNNCNLGYDIGIVTGVGPILEKQNQFEVSDVQLEVWIGALDVSSLIGAFSSNYLADRFGRKGCMAISEVLFIVSVLGMACAQNYAMLILFRCFCGIAVGLGLTIGPLYIGEIAPDHLRGKLISWSELATNVGLLVAFCVGFSLSGLPKSLSWRLMLGLGSLLPCVLLGCLHYMPESPRWLIVMGREQEAETVLKQVYNDDIDAAAMVRDIKDAISLEQELYARGGWHAILHPSPSVHYALLAALGIAAIQQLSGIEAITSYFLFIFDRAGVESSDTYIYLILFGVCKLVTVYIAGLYFDNPRYGRRKLLLLSGVGVAVCMLVFCVIFAFDMTAASKSVVVTFMFVYVISYSVGYGPGTWVVMLEVLPMQIRAKGLSLAMVVNRVIATLLSGTFLTLVHSMTYTGYFAFFLVVCVACVVYVYALIPETQGRSLEEMSTLFQRTQKFGTFSDTVETGTGSAGSINSMGGVGSASSVLGGGRGRGHSRGGDGSGEYNVVRSVLHSDDATTASTKSYSEDGGTGGDSSKQLLQGVGVTTTPVHIQQ